MGKFLINLAMFLTGILFLEIIIGNLIGGNLSQMKAEKFHYIILATFFLIFLSGFLGLIIDCRKGGKNV